MNKTTVGSFVWYEVTTDDPLASQGYYAEVLGWKKKSMEMAPGVTYRMLEAETGQQMGFLPSEPRMPPQFTQYLAVFDVDAIAESIERHGGKVLSEPKDIPVGRIAIVADPQGAAFALFSGRKEQEGSSTEFHWNELWSPDAKTALPFYEKVFGLTIDTMNMPDQKEPYYLLKNGENLLGGVMTSPMKGIPPMWLSYVKVHDLDATLSRAQARGGELVSPVQTVPNVGRFGIVKEPRGPVLGYIAPADRR